MVLVVALALGLWFLGRMLGAPIQARWLMIGLLYVAVLAALIVLPAGSPLSEALGGSAGSWLVVGGIGAAIWAYSRGLARLRRRVRPENRLPDHPVDTEGPLTGAEVDRYARHIVLHEIGGGGQQRLKRARVLVVGAGGLGAPAMLYLGAAGVGTLGVIDDDTVEVANLQRQVIHSEKTLGMPKVFSAQTAVAALNPHVTVRPYHRRLTDEIAGALVADYDLVLDGSDSFDTRHAVNRACVAARVPLVSGAIARWEGQLSLFDPARGTPCYACLFPTRPAPGTVAACAEAGVAGPLPGVVGTMMALEALKDLTGAGRGLAGRLLIYDGLQGEHRQIAVARRGDCPVCGTGAAGPTARQHEVTT